MAAVGEALLMDPLTTDDAAAILSKAGAKRIALKQKAFGKLMGLLAFFEHRGTGHVWRIRGHAWKQNFEKDVERELA